MDITKEEGQIKLAPHESAASTPQSSLEGESTPDEGAGEDGTRTDGLAEGELPVTLADLLGYGKQYIYRVYAHFQRNSVLTCCIECIFNQ